MDSVFGEKVVCLSQHQNQITVIPLFNRGQMEENASFIIHVFKDGEIALQYLTIIIRAWGLLCIYSLNLECQPWYVIVMRCHLYFWMDTLLSSDHSFSLG